MKIKNFIEGHSSKIGQFGEKRHQKTAGRWRASSNSAFAGRNSSPRAAAPNQNCGSWKFFAGRHWPGRPKPHHDFRIKDGFASTVFIRCLGLRWNLQIGTGFVLPTLGIFKHFWYKNLVRSSMVDFVNPEYSLSFLHCFPQNRVHAIRGPSSWLSKKLINYNQIRGRKQLLLTSRKRKSKRFEQWSQKLRCMVVTSILRFSLQIHKFFRNIF